MKKQLAVLIGVSMLAACNQGAGGEEEKAKEEELTASSVLTAAEKAHQDLQSVEVSFSQMDDYGWEEEGVASYDFAENVTHIETKSPKLTLFKDSEEFLFISDISSYTRDEKAKYESLLDRMTSEHKNPLAHFKEYDENLFGKFELEEKDGSYLLTYTGSEDDRLLLIESLAQSYVDYNARTWEEDPEDIEFDEVTADSFELSFDIDKDTNRIMSYKIKADYAIDIDGYEREFEADDSYIFSAFDEVAAIEKPDKDLTAVGNLSYDQQEQYEQEAADYVDAMIQATVFQNEEEYAARAPGDQSEDEKKEEGAKQKDEFGDLFKMFFGLGLEELNVNEDVIEEASAAYLKLLQGSNYLMLESNAQSEDTFEVVVSVEGIMLDNIQREIDLLLQNELNSGSISEESSEEELVQAMVSVLEKVAAEDHLAEAREVSVEVNRAGGSYMILDQDQYLDAFIQ
ncbi:DUF6612 family protein [Shouchella clausii]|uniref:DUF6612 family protein n=1 Tax=Shouchella clausii TaxID=79880 RepID=UPI0031FD1A8C